MANRLLTADQIVSLFTRSMVGEAFTTHPASDETHIKIVHMGTGLSEDFTTQDRILSDGDFIKNRIVPFEARVRSSYKASERYAPCSLLGERGKTHGDYDQMAAVIQSIKFAMQSGNWEDLTATQKESLDLTATKIGRIVCGDPNHRDHWDDIIGYATLARDRIPVKKG